jgi:hypothetical protein
MVGVLADGFPEEPDADSEGERGVGIKIELAMQPAQRP